MSTEMINNDGNDAIKCSKEEIIQGIRRVWNHKMAGQAFYSFQSLLNHHSTLWSSTIKHIQQQIKEQNIQFDAVVGIGSRGYVLMSILATIYNVRPILADKQGKLPGPVYTSKPYGTEYSLGNVQEIGQEAFETVDNISVTKVLIVDDLEATGGSFASVVDIVENQAKRQVTGLVEIGNIAECPRLELLNQYPTIKIGALSADPATNPDPMLKIRYEARKQQPKFLDVVNDKIKPGQIVVIAHPSFYGWVKTLQALYPNVFVPVYINWKQYADGSPDSSINQFIKAMSNKFKVQVLFLFDSTNMSKLFEQISVLSILPDYIDHEYHSIHQVVPFNFFGTQERFSYVGQVAAANTFAHILSAPIIRGPIKLTMYDLHYPANTFNFRPTIQPNYNQNETTAIIQLLNLIDTKNITIAFPDDGAFKRFTMLDYFRELKLPTIIFLKKRDDKDPNKRSLYFKETENFPQGAIRCTDAYHKQLKHVLIIDDLVQSGGTLDECRKALVKEGAHYISCYCTHAVFPKQAYKKFLPSESSGKLDSNINDCINRFYITNTNPTVTDKLEDLAPSGKNPFFVLNLAITLAKSLYDEKMDESKDKMFKFPFYMCSGKNLKYDAHCEAINYSFLPFRPEYKEVQSGINEQPFGKEEIEKGGNNRLDNVAFIDDKTAIESGFIEKRVQLPIKHKDKLDNQESKYKLDNQESKDNQEMNTVDLIYDYSYIITQIRQKRYSRWTEGVYVPRSIFEESKATGFKVTGGQILSKKTRPELLKLVNEYETLFNLPLSTLEMIPEQVDHRDWYLLFGPRTRKQVLKENLIALYQDLILYYSAL